MNKTELHQIYTPIADFIVVEFITVSKTEGGILLTDNAKEDYSRQMAWKVVAKGPDVKHLNLNDYVLVGPNARPIGVPLLHKKEDDTQHVQLHEYEVLGKVDKDFINSKSTSKTVLH